MTMRSKQENMAEFERIASHDLPGFDTLETRNSDRLDFHEASVWGVAEALQAAYALGYHDAEAAARHVRGGYGANAPKTRASSGGRVPTGWDIFKGATASGRETAWFAGNPHTGDADGPFSSREKAVAYARSYRHSGARFTGGKRRSATPSGGVSRLRARRIRRLGRGL